MKLTGKRSAFYTYTIPIVVGVVFILFGAFWAHSQKNIFRKQTMSILNNESELIMEAIKSIIQSQMRIGRIDQQRLNFILNNILEKTSINFLCIKNNSKIIYESDDLPPLVGGISEGNFMLQETYYCWKNFNLENIPPPMPKGKNRPPNHLMKMMFDDMHDDNKGCIFDFRNASQQIIVGLDGSLYISQIKTETQKLLIILIIGCFGVIVIVLAWIHFIKSNSLKFEFEKIRMRNEKLEEMSLAAAGLAHEVKNPLGIIRGFAQKLSASAEDPDSIRSISEKILDEVDLTTERLSDFINYARKRTLKSNVMEARKEIQEITEMLRFEFEEKKISFNCDIEDIKILADKDCLQQILVNIMMNSIHACSSGSQISLEMRRVHNNAVMIISDTGRGVYPELLKDIFKPYVSGSHKGHGMGLAIVRKLVEEHGWEIRMNSKLSKGTITEISGIKLVDHE